MVTSTAPTQPLKTKKVKCDYHEFNKVKTKANKTKRGVKPVWLEITEY